MQHLISSEKDFASQAFQSGVHNSFQHATRSSLCIHNKPLIVYIWGSRDLGGIFGTLLFCKLPLMGVMKTRTWGSVKMLTALSFRNVAFSASEADKLIIINQITFIKCTFIKFLGNDIPVILLCFLSTLQGPVERKVIDFLPLCTMQSVFLSFFIY